MESDMFYLFAHMFLTTINADRSHTRPVHQDSLQQKDFRSMLKKRDATEVK